MYKKVKYFVGDFETTVYDGQQDTRVWASCLCPLFTEDAIVLHSIEDTWEYLKGESKTTNLIIYYHNLKFDGSFWLSFFLENHFPQAIKQKKENGVVHKSFKENKEMLPGELKYTISNQGLWYTITVKTGKYFIEFRDSLKLLPFSVYQLGKSFDTKHKKLEMEYKGKRYPGCPITEKEEEYIKNDVFVVKEALEFMFSQGHKKLTTASCCISEYREILKTSLSVPMDYKEMFPDLKKYNLDKYVYGADNADQYIRKSYRGGWCYLVKGKERRVFKNGVTADVNSLYPSMMHSDSGNRFPVGYPIFWKGNFIPEEAEKHYFFVRVKTRFEIKPGFLPFIQVKNSFLYHSNECLETTDIIKDGERYSYFYDSKGNLHDTRREMTFTMTDYKLFLEHYDASDFEILDGCWFYDIKGIFDEYINKWKKIKMESKGAMRSLAKLFMNSLYGRLAISDNSSFKIAYLKEDGALGFLSVEEHDKVVLYIPCGSAITSYARNFTIRAAQKNFYGPNKRGFIYADTDSIHCDLDPGEVKGIRIHDKDFCCWKLESSWDCAYFLRQKTYIEHVIKENLEEIDNPYYNVKCAGMPETSKALFSSCLPGGVQLEEKEGNLYKDGKKLIKESEDVKNFLYDKNGKRRKRKISDFDLGLEVPGKLTARQVPGGQLLVETTYKMR